MLNQVRIWRILSRVCLFSCLVEGATTASCGQTPSEMPNFDKSNPSAENHLSHRTTGQLGITVDSVRVLVSPQTGNRKPVEITGWHESEAFRLLPSREFDLVCRLRVGEASYRTDSLVRTTIDFLVAPASMRYERMSSERLGQEKSWSEITEMHDLKTVSVRSLRPEESRLISIRGFDLANVMAAFPADDVAPLWPWFMRINVFLQDRSGKEVASAHRTFSIRPHESRIKNR
jgi:hypothetical protein